MDEAALTEGRLPTAAKSVSADKKGVVDLRRALGGGKNKVGYAYAEIESIHQRETVLRYMSDDGVKIWLNGQPVHENDVHKRHEGEAPIFLKEGKNRLLAKVTCEDGGNWAIRVAIPKANF